MPLERLARLGHRTLLGAMAFAILAQGVSATESAASTAIPVVLTETDSGWQLLRGGENYFIKGAGGDADIEALAALGANSLRLWGADDIGDTLDAAHAAGLSVTVGIWLGHERHGFDYSDEQMVADQLARVRETVIEYRDHPALLIWSLGNEMEGFEAGDNPKIWNAVNEAAALVKQLDPHHPTMTVTAEIGGERVRYVHEVCDAIDIHGINSYGGAPSLAERLDAAGATKPYILTEFGPRGAWEAPQTSWGAALEPTSSEKADHYAIAYQRAIASQPGRALGGYAFTWGHKVEATDTWFGMLLRDDALLASSDRMQEIWSGKPAAYPAPSISPIELSTSSELKPGSTLTATVDIDAAVELEWVLYPETADYLTGGDYRPALIAVDDAIVDAQENRARVRVPDEPGFYRLAVYARDGNGKAATANVPIRVLGEHAAVQFPVYVFEDEFAGMPWAPSGWMGDTESLELSVTNDGGAHSGARALKVRYEGLFGWAAVAWQHPANDWGELPGGFDLTGAGKLELWARGEYGGERVKFGVGLLEADRPYPDSTIREITDIVLTDQWTRYEIPLNKQDLSQIKTGFVFALEGRRTPVTFYLDRIRYVR
ncbi:MAG: glycoside hydrolase family 2 TIM barrel-domain containing protein [Pseudomonadota bacterium]